MKIKLLLISALLAGNIAAAEEKNETVKEAVGYIKMLGSRLKSELQENIKQDPSGVGAMGFCSASAMKITEEINGKLPAYASVRRTALKYRNPQNAPDAADEKVMREIVGLVNSKHFDPESPLKVLVDEKSTRVYKPLFTEKACLKCHGSEISPEVARIIKEQYPKDGATGFSEGAFRGVIVAEIKKH